GASTSSATLAGWRGAYQGRGAVRAPLLGRAPVEGGELGLAARALAGGGALALSRARELRLVDDDGAHRRRVVAAAAAARAVDAHLEGEASRHACAFEQRGAVGASRGAPA